MISLSSASRLAYTKLKTRRIRLTITLLATSLLFSLLIAASLIITGAYQSFDKFSQESLSGRYLIQANGDPILWGETRGTSRDPALIGRAESLYKQLQEQKQEKAETLGISYRADPSKKPVWTGPGGKKVLNITSSIGIQVVNEKYAAETQVNQQSLIHQLGSNYQPIHVYKSLAKVYNGTDSPTLSIVKDGHEITQQETTNTPKKIGPETMAQGVWRLFSDGLLNSFLLPGQNLDVGSDGSLPVVAPRGAVIDMLGLKDLPADASAQVKSDRLKMIRQKARGLRFQLCYRNQTSENLFEQAVQQQANLKVNGKKDDYVRPSLLYDLPKQPCGPVRIVSDTRSAQQKLLDEKQLEFDQYFGQTKPAHQLLTFRVVGLTTDYGYNQQKQPGFTPSQIIDEAFTDNVGGGWISPISLRGKNSAINAYFQQEKGGGVFGKQQAYFAEFASANQARQALLDKSCQINSPDRELNQKEVFGIKLPSDQNNHTCSRDKWPYKLGAFGGNAILVGQIKDKLGSWLLLAGAVIAVIASLILMTMLGRIVADSRKETAIFRALGASRLSIMQVYLTYTTFLILWVIGLSFALGLTLAFTFDYYLSPDFSLAAAVAFSVNNLDKKFGFIGLDWLTLLEIFAIIIVTGLLASVMPILRSVRRNPIKDMREE